MREKDFEAVACARIERARREEDYETLGRFLTENYPVPVQKRACEALSEIASEECMEKLFEALFFGGLPIETEAAIISVLSEMMTAEDFEAMTSSYDLSSDKRTVRLYTVLGRCIKN